VIRWFFLAGVSLLIGFGALAPRTSSLLPPSPQERRVHITVNAFVDTNCNGQLDSVDEPARDCSLYLHFALTTPAGCLIPNANGQDNPQSTIYSINGHAWAEFDVIVPSDVDTLVLELLAAEGGRYPYVLCPNSPGRRQISLPPGDFSAEARFGIRRYIPSRDAGTPIPTATPPVSDIDLTPSPTATATATLPTTSTAPPTYTPTLRPTGTAPPEPTPTLRPTSTASPEPTPTLRPTSTASPEPTLTATVTPTLTPPEWRTYLPLLMRSAHAGVSLRDVNPHDRILNPGWSRRPLSYPCQPTPTPRPSPTPYQCFP